MATIIVGTNSYVTEAELQTYADDRGIVIQGADLSVLLINAMDYIETRSYSGQKFDADQSLEFPRYYTATAPDTAPDVPENIKNAEITAALLIDSGVDLFATIGRAVKREKVDVLEVEYMDNAADKPLYQKLNAYLSGYLASSNNGFQFSVTRT